MKYFGVPTCPYCKKRVNLIRTWSLKRQGEYCCPRCAGISNIYLSPLIYVFALLAIGSGGAVYFFHKFILDDISLSIVFQVFLPFAVFFLLSLFMVYLEKPVIKKVPKSAMTKKQWKEHQKELQRTPQYNQPVQYDRGEYLPREEHTPAPRTEPPTKIAVQPAPVPKAVSSQNMLEKTAVIPQAKPPQQVSTKTQVIDRIPAERPASQPATRTAIKRPTQTELPRPVAVSRRREETAASTAVSAQKPRNTVFSTDDFFAKYDDPDYVQRRLRELGEQDD